MNRREKIDEYRGGDLQFRSSVAVILLNYRRRELCLSQIRAICAQPCPAIISLVNNGPSDRVTTLDLTGTGDRVILTDLDSNIGFARGVNAGIATARAAGANAFLVLNPDVQMEHQAIQRLVQSLEQADGLVIIVPRSVTRTSRLGFRYRSQSAMILRKGGNSLHVPLLAAFAWLIPERVLDVVGPFDGEFFFGREDTDMCLRLYLSGGRFIEEPDAIVDHILEGGSPMDKPTLRIRSFHMMRGRLLLMKKYPVGAYGSSVAFSQLFGIVHDVISGFVNYRDLDAVAWQMRGLVPGSSWPIST